MSVDKLISGAAVLLVLASCGGGGGASERSGPNPQRTLVRGIDQQNLFYRVPAPGDEMTYKYQASDGTNLAEGIVNTTFFSLDDNGLPFSDRWQMRLQQISLPDGTMQNITYAYFVTEDAGSGFAEEIFLYSDDDGVYGRLDENNNKAFYGSIAFPNLSGNNSELSPGGSYIEKWFQEIDTYSGSIFGETTHAISAGTSQINSGIGIVEVYRYTSTSSYTEYFGSGGVNETTEGSTTTWIHPQIGMIKTETSLEITTCCETYTITGSFLLDDVNFPLPAAR